MIDKHCVGPFNIDRCAFERRYSTGKIIWVTPLKSRAFYMNESSVFDFARAA